LTPAPRCNSAADHGRPPRRRRASLYPDRLPAVRHFFTVPAFRRGAPALVQSGWGL